MNDIDILRKENIQIKNNQFASFQLHISLKLYTFYKRRELNRQATRNSCCNYWSVCCTLMLIRECDTKWSINALFLTQEEVTGHYTNEKNIHNQPVTRGYQLINQLRTTDWWSGTFQCRFIKQKQPARTGSAGSMIWSKWNTGALLIMRNSLNNQVTLKSLNLLQF